MGEMKDLMLMMEKNEDKKEIRTGDVMIKIRKRRKMT